MIADDYYKNCVRLAERIHRCKLDRHDANNVVVDGKWPAQPPVLVDKQSRMAAIEMDKTPLRLLD